MYTQGYNSLGDMMGFCTDEFKISPAKVRQQELGLALLQYCPSTALVLY